ncbi:P2-like prophage tail protein X [Sphingomonas laterariae]|uniref:P2-like prophage tail protein X n=1 Tax=Edaphosphingomonas laterariae TaxID=861865 RepID=A0A239CKE5_9SPHN|nr:tail protein X [Sphingomonas laterariae]SNS20158.1 P2-like prophage tail protein X [Sphingomonas laterariae]
MPIMVRARQGDTLDALIWREAALGSAAIGAVLEANPGLADFGPVLPLGTPVTIPDMAPVAVADPLINLWD